MAGEAEATAKVGIRSPPLRLRHGSAYVGAAVKRVRVLSPDLWSLVVGLFPMSPRSRLRPCGEVVPARSSLRLRWDMAAANLLERSLFACVGWWWFSAQDACRRLLVLIWGRGGGIRLSLARRCGVLPGSGACEARRVLPEGKLPPAECYFESRSSPLELVAAAVLQRRSARCFACSRYISTYILEHIKLCVC